MFQTLRLILFFRFRANIIYFLQAIYTPNPVDTKATDLPQALVPMQEKIAENLHELWAMNRIQGMFPLKPID